MPISQEAWTTYGDALQTWHRNLPALSWDELAPEGKGSGVALCVVDMLNGFARQGPLASERVAALGQRVVQLVQQAADRNVRVVAVHDCHKADAPEFAVFPAHCVEGSDEARAVEELEALPAYQRALSVPKNSLCALLPGGWHEDLVRSGVHSFVVVGDCTDYCINYLAVPLKLWANEHHQQLRVVVPANAVDTFDVPLDAAPPGHPADILHLVFLRHMAEVGVDVVRDIR